MKASILCPTKHGVPHHRPRVFIVGILRSVVCHAFEWPTESGRLPLRPFLQEAALAPSLSLRPPDSQGVALKNWKAGMAMLIKKGHHPLKTDCVINIDGRKPSYMVERVPCLTATRASNGGHWVTSRGRRLTTPEMQAIMGIQPARLHQAGTSDRRFHRMLGNAIAVNVLERIFVQLLPAMGLVHRSALNDRWGTPDGQRSAASALWKPVQAV